VPDPRITLNMILKTSGINMLVFIDTRIWILSRKTPDVAKYPDPDEYQQALENHERADEFLTRALQDKEIAMTFHQLSEIFHVLAFRGNKLPKDYVAAYCNQLLQEEFIRWYVITADHVKESIRLSKESGIHVWDYLCVIPLVQDVDIIYSCDKHFSQPSFTSLGPPVENPMSEWLME